MGSGPQSGPLFLALSFLLTGIGNAGAEPLVLSTAFGSPPMHTQAQDGRFDRLMGEAFARIGCEVEVVGNPAERGLLNADSGLDDGDGPRVAGLERTYTRLVRVPERVMRMAFVGFAAADGPRDLSGWAGLAEYDVGIIRGWKILERNVRGRSLAVVRTPDILFGLLARRDATRS